MRLAWITDIHLNFVEPATLQEFFVQLRDTNADAFAISGDIGEATSVQAYLQQLDELLQKPIYFVLGNHDFYYGNLAHVRAQTCQLCHERTKLHYLTDASFHSLNEHTAILGHDGWADGREGDYLRSYVSMHDYRLIADLANLSKLMRWNVLQKLGDEAAAHIRKHLPRALERHEHVILVTHVPPLREACWYDGRISDDEWSPHFTCKAMGNVLLEIMDDHPDRRLTVLCGHTHGCGEAQPRPNIMIYTGGAEYGHPAISRIIDFP